MRADRTAASIRSTNCWGRPTDSAYRPPSWFRCRSGPRPRTTPPRRSTTSSTGSWRRSRNKLGGWPVSTSTPTWARASVSGASVTTTSCSRSSPADVACGFHAGDPAGLLRVCRSAAERGVRIGAQVSYRDLAGFGRRFIDVATEAGPKASWYPVAKPAPCWRIRRRSPTAS